MKDIILTRLSDLNKITKSEIGSFNNYETTRLQDKSYGWSIIQVFSHLNLAEHNSLLYMKRKINAGDQMPNTNWTNSLKMTLSKIAFVSNLKWKAPTYVSNPPNELSLDEISKQWMQTRTDIEDFIKAYPEVYLKKAVYKHPMAGRLNLSDAVESFYYHFVHHKHQIKRIKKELERNG